MSQWHNRFRECPDGAVTDSATVLCPVPLTRRRCAAATSPRKRGEVSHKTSGLMTFSTMGAPSITLSTFFTACTALRSIDSRVTPAMCGAVITLSSVSSGLSGSGGSRSSTSRPAGRNDTRREGRVQILLVDDAAARGVDQIRGRLHALQSRRVEHADGLVGLGAVDGDEIGALER